MNPEIRAQKRDHHHTLLIVEEGKTTTAEASKLNVSSRFAQSKAGPILL